MERRAITITGLVQGVGFRPFVHGLAARHGLHGFVQNRTGSVLIEVEGPPPSLDAFLAELATGPPPLARIDELRWTPWSPLGDPEFRIAPSAADAEPAVLLSADAATCDACLAELRDPADRRYRYPFLNCTQCGPRLTVVTGAPYDRERTTLAAFPLCADCRAEYEDPSDRRFHAQPTACPVCGPALSWIGEGEGEPLEAAALRIEAGGIVAIKGLGGFHLACDAGSEPAVAALRSRKGREAKPFAVMVPDLEAARALCEMGLGAGRLLASRQRPIVLLPRRPGGPVAPSVAPGSPRLGLMLPYTPLHHLLMERLRRPVVLTSGNRGGEPIAFRDGEALERLAGIADGFLTHDRPIAARCDDSVTLWTGRRAVPVRRSRGYAPEPLILSAAAPRPLLALGGHQKNAFCLLRGRHAILSPHVGDLETLEALEGLREGLRHYEELFEFRPEAVACDLHPDYASARLAGEIARERGIPRIEVQHHHAHAASVLAEHGLAGPALALVLDGTGLGTDGTLWGCEFLEVEGARMARLGHLETVRMPGGEAAVREPWRMALAWLLHAWDGALPDLDLPPLREADGRARALLERMIARGVNAPLTSSAGRLFDAVASLAGLRQRADFEGQPAMELEGIAAWGPALPYPFEIAGGPAGFVVRFAPAVRALAAEAAGGGDPRRISARFHRTVVAALAAGAERARAERGLDLALLSGGCFQNALLLEGAVEALAARGFTVCTNQRVPPNDGGLALGQAAVAAARLAEEEEGA